LHYEVVAHPAVCDREDAAPRLTEDGDGAERIALELPEGLVPS